MKLTLLIAVFLLLDLRLESALAQAPATRKECPERLTEDGLCTSAGTKGAPSTAPVFSTEREAVLDAKCYAICASKHVQVKNLQWLVIQYIALVS